MSIEKIKAALKAVKSDETDLVWIEECFIDLVKAIAEYIICESTYGDQQLPVPPGYITVRDFARRYVFVSKSHLNNICWKDEEFKKSCTFRKGKFWYIHEDRTIEYLVKKPTFRNRVKRGYFKEKSDASISNDLIKEN
jgi:hypothetical protein